MGIPDGSIASTLMPIMFLDDPDIQIQPQAELSEFTTFRLGGTCEALIRCQTPNQLIKVIRHCHQNHWPFILIGGGSNLVVCDEGLDCYVIRYVTDTPIIERQDHDLIVSGSTPLDALAHFAVEEGLDGLICTTGIPGTVGGAIAGNAGAFGQQVGDVLKNVQLISPSGVFKKTGPESLDFRYRRSLLTETNDIVLSARFQLTPGHRAALQKKREEILSLRRAKHPDLTTHPCAGSIFRNIEPTSNAKQRQAAGWFLDQAGAKSLKVGGAVIFEKHANIIVKTDGCRAQDVFELSLQMSALVKKKFDIDLVREVRFVGRFRGMPDNVHTIMW